jgi:DNA-binding CsgD family transcriptional regulator
MSAGEILGRERELRLLDAFLERAVDGSSSLMLEGEPGIGKTTLWWELVRRAERRRVRVLSCRPVEAESKLSFAGLADLLEAVPGEAFESLPTPQRRALEVALLRSDPGEVPPDPRAVATAFLAVLVSLAESSAVLVAIDDAQWLDVSSAEVVAFGLRRASVLAVVARRAGETLLPVLQEVFSDAELVALRPFTLGATHELLKLRLGRSLPRPLLVRVHEAAQGNPFYALEVGREVLRSGVSTGDPLPVPTDLRRLLTRRIARLSPAAQELLLAAAAVGQPTRALLGTVLDHDPSAAVEEAEVAGLVELQAGRVCFAHPLYVAAVYSTAPRERRRRLHGRLAEAVDNEEERARHLALAAESPSEQLASVLEQAAGQARARGAPPAAAELLELATNLTPAAQRVDARRRKLATADAYVSSGAIEQARAILQELVDDLPPGDERADVLACLAEVTPDVEGTIALLEQAASEVETDKAVRSRIHLLLGTEWPSRGIEHALRHGHMALRYAEQAGQRRLAVRALAKLALWELWAGRNPSRLLERALAKEQPSDELRGYDDPRLPLAMFRAYQGRLDDARTQIDALLDEADRLGDEIGSLAFGQRLVDVELRAGNWSLATLHVERLYEFAGQVGFEHDGGFTLTLKAWVDSHLGRTAAARSSAEAGVQIAQAAKLQNTLVMNCGVLGFLELSLGNDAGALEHLRPLLDWLAEKELGLPTHPMMPHALEALIAAGSVDEARTLIVRFETEARTLESPWALAIAMRCRGLLAAADGDLVSASTELESALRFHDGGRWPFENARTLLIRGRVQRRAKQKAAAKRSLEQALAIFEQLPAPLWAERTQEELRRIGLRPSTRDELTETERQVAELAASGLKNREVAAQLFLSPKTVEGNLARVYRKLGIRSRAELGARLAAEGRESAQA